MSPRVCDLGCFCWGLLFASRLCLLVRFFFFFSSRRRHTRCLSYWSSDVCSSDLGFSEGCYSIGPQTIDEFIHRQHSISDVVIGEGRNQLRCVCFCKIEVSHCRKTLPFA